jgi:hypothetical protein
MSEFSANFVNFSVPVHFIIAYLRPATKVSQTSSNNSVWSIRCWSAKCDITVKLLNERAGLMTIISETLVYFS